MADLIGLPTRGSIRENASAAEPVAMELADFIEFTGWTDAVGSVEIRARVSGYLNEIQFQAGGEVALRRSKNTGGTELPSVASGGDQFHPRCEWHFSFLGTWVEVVFVSLVA